MGEIIIFSKNYNKNRYDEIIRELQNRKGMYTYSEIADYANRILEESRDFNSNEGAIAIIKIANELGIQVYRAKLTKKVLGKISINRNIKRYNGNDKIILVNEDTGARTQRITIAYLLGCYLFNYVGSYNQIEGKYFKNKRVRNKNNDIYYRFAIEILIPRGVYSTQIAIAMQNIYLRRTLLWQLADYFVVNTDDIMTRSKI